MALRWLLAAAATSLLLCASAAAEPLATAASVTGDDRLDQTAQNVHTAVDRLDPPDDPSHLPAHLANLVSGEEPEESPPAQPPRDSDDPGFADRVREAFSDQAIGYSMLSGAAVLVGLGGFALVSRYISPKEALKNPQRAMLYGFIRATPGAHLKQLSDEFGMKTSSILWHIRKLESAQLVKSDRVNGYRVFYPCEGGIEVRRVSRAMAALQNDNAMRVYEHLNRHPGGSARSIAERLALHGGTARWHLRKLREHGLLDELVQEGGSRFYPTPLGNRALEARVGRPTDAPQPSRRPVASE